MSNKEWDDQVEEDAIKTCMLLGRLHQLNPNLTFADYLEMKRLGEIPYWVSDLRSEIPKKETYKYIRGER